MTTSCLMTNRDHWHPRDTRVRPEAVGAMFLQCRHKRVGSTSEPKLLFTSREAAEVSAPKYPVYASVRIRVQREAIRDQATGHLLPIREFKLWRVPGSLAYAQEGIRIQEAKTELSEGFVQ